MHIIPIISVNTERNWVYWGDIPKRRVNPNTGVIMKNPVFSSKSKCFHQNPGVFNKTTPWDKVWVFNKNEFY